jgi:iron complex outermembrane recepter protein
MFDVRVSSCCCAATGLLAGTLLSNAMAADRAEETPFFENLPTVLTVSRMPQSTAEAPGAVTVLGQEVIRASGARTIPDLLRLVPGFYVAFKNGHFASVTHHGYTDDYSRRMQVLIDGRSVYTPYFVGGVDWASLPITIEDIDTIEVVRGTNSAAFGSNAFLGVVNIITKSAAQGKGFRAEVTQGQKGIQDRLTRFGFADDRMAARFTYGLRKDDGFDNVHDTHRTEVFNGRFDWTLAANTSLSIWGGGARGKRRDGYAFLADQPTVPNTVYPPHDFTTGTGFGQVKLRHAFTADNEVIVHYYHNRERGTEQFNSQTPPPFSLPLNFNADRLATRDDFEIQHVFVPLRSLRVAWGGEVRRDTLQSALALGTSARQSADLARIFANGEWRLAPEWIVNAGLTYEDHSLSGDNTSPRLYLNYLPSKAHAFRIGHSRGYRTPTIFEDRTNWQVRSGPLLVDQLYLASGGLRAERVDTSEIGYVGNLAALGGSVDVRLFQQKFHDWLCRIVRPLPSTVVELTSEQVAYDFANCKTAAKKRGVEIGARLRPFRGTLIAAAWSYHRDSSRLGADNDIGYSAPEGTSLTGVPGTPGAFTHTGIHAPRHLGSLLIGQALPWQTNASVTWYHVTAGRIPPSQLVGFHVALVGERHVNRIDARLAKSVVIGSTRTEFAIVGQNLGRASAEMFQAQPFTRRWMGTVAFDL